MTRDQLVQLLTSTANSMQTLNDFFPPTTVSTIISTIQKLDDTAIDLILTVAKLNNPLLTKEHIQKGISTVIQVLTSLGNLVSSGETNRIASLCNNLKKRNILLSLASHIL